MWLGPRPLKKKKKKKKRKKEKRKKKKKSSREGTHTCRRVPRSMRRQRERRHRISRALLRPLDKRSLTFTLTQRLSTHLFRFDPPPSRFGDCSKMKQFGKLLVGDFITLSGSCKLWYHRLSTSSSSFTYSCRNSKLS